MPVVKPRRVNEEFLVQQLPDETMLFHRASSSGYALSRIAASVWNHCDGRRTTSALATAVSRELGEAISEDVVLLALEELGAASLLHKAVSTSVPRLTRRKLLPRVAAAIAVTVFIAPGASRAQAT